MKLTLQALLAFTTLALSASAGLVPRSSFVVKEEVNAPSTWVRRSVAGDNDRVALRFALKQRDLQTLETRVLQTSDPEHKLYGRHLTKDEVNSYLAPEKRTIQEVEHWLRSSDIHIDEQLAARSSSLDAFTVHVPVWKARELLDTDLHVFEHRDTGALAIRAERYSVPRHVDEHLDYVGGLTYFGTPKAHKSDAIIIDDDEDSIAASKKPMAAGAAGDPPACNASSVTSLCLRQLYNTVDYVPKAPSAQLIGVSGFLEEYPNYSDYFKFLQEQRPDAYKAGYNFTVTSVNGGLNDQALPGGEADLDVETIGGFSYPIPFEYYSTGGRPPFQPDIATPTVTNEPYEQQLNYLLSLGDDKLPKVLSTSYGDDEQTVPRAYATRVCNLIMAMGARGVSTLYSSGDNGVGLDGACYSNGAVRANGTAQFLPAFPASCPWATTVGGTQRFSPEVAVGDDLAGFYAGGGFSDYFDQPSYQAKAVKHYLSKFGKKEYAGLYNPSGRGYPDVAAQGSLYRIWYKNRAARIGGTSASAPTFASVVALLNDKRLSEGKSTLGFLNPLIYSKWLGSSALNDITSGSSAGCDTTGFPAQKGWDPVTGAGTPNFVELAKTV
ncbi:subtilisin-like protein [Testicularia cyperi]|uniref:tripeptidyl-peptidase II n=1 Tax=Testicularia cyperi TaxID=1882483 RepID=A0A317XJL1_9BASI|nr:subtilisin-like protein [Testicularia cyperi]